MPSSVTFDAVFDQAEAGLGVYIERILLFLFIVLVPFQDSILLHTPIASALSIVPLMLLLTFAVGRWILETAPAVNRSVFCVGLYVFLICAIHLFDGGVSLQEWLPLIRYLLLTILVLFATFGLDYSQVLSLRTALYAAFVFTVVGAILDIIFGRGFMGSLHITPAMLDRPRGFSSEASTLSVQIVCSGMLTAHFLLRKWMKWMVALVTCGLLIASGSKGGLIALLLCVLVMATARSMSSSLLKILIWCVTIPVVYFGSFLLMSRFTMIVESNETSTIATRLSMSVYAILTLAHHPLGVGFTGFFPSIPRYLPTAMDFVQSFFPFPLWFYEVRTYLSPPYAEADCKTFFFDFLVFFGIPFAIVFIRFTYRLLARLLQQRCYWLFVGTLFAVVALFTYYSTIKVYAIPLLFGISLHEIRKRETLIRMQ